MAKKLYGAAKAARAKRLAKAKRSRGRKSNPGKKNPKRVAAGKKGAAAKKRKATAAAYHSGASAYSAGIAKRKKRRKPAKRKAAAAKRTTKRTSTGTRTAAQRSASARKAARTRKRNLLGTSSRPARRVKRRKNQKSYTRYGQKGLVKARKRILRAKKRPGAKRTLAYMRRTNMMKVNPSNGMMSAMKQVLPIAGSFYVSKLLSKKLSELPMVSNITSKLPMNLGRPVLSGVILAAAHYGTKKGALAKHRTGLMLGTALAFVDSIIATFAPADVKAMMGVGEYVSMSEYVSTNEYVSSGDYVSMSGTPAGYDYNDPNPHGLYAIDGLHEVHAIHGIDEELGMIEAGVDTGNNNGIFANGW